MAFPFLPVAMTMQAVGNLLGRSAQRKQARQQAEADVEAQAQQRRQDLLTNLMGFVGGQGFQGFSPVRPQPIPQTGSSLADLLSITGQGLGQFRQMQQAEEQAEAEEGRRMREEAREMTSLEALNELRRAQAESFRRPKVTAAEKKAQTTADFIDALRTGGILE